MITEAIILASHSYLSKEFRRGLKKLPMQVQDIAAEKYRRWRADAKTVNFEPTFSNIFGIEITRDIHAICELVGKDVYWLWVGGYRDYTSRLDLLRKTMSR